MVIAHGIRVTSHFLNSTKPEKGQKRNEGSPGPAVSVRYEIILPMPNQLMAGDTGCKVEMR